MKPLNTPSNKEEENLCAATSHQESEKLEQLGLDSCGD